MFVKCDFCGHYFETSEKYFGYCPHCERDDIELRRTENEKDKTN